MNQTRTRKSSGESASGNELARFSAMIDLVRNRMHSELAGMDREQQKGSGSSESRIKLLNALFKALQGVEEMANRVEVKREEQSLEGTDIVEFRRQLEKQIQSVIDAQPKATVS